MARYIPYAQRNKAEYREAALERASGERAASVERSRLTDMAKVCLDELLEQSQPVYLEVLRRATMVDLVMRKSGVVDWDRTAKYGPLRQSREWSIKSVNEGQLITGGIATYWPKFKPGNEGRIPDSYEMHPASLLVGLDGHLWTEFKRDAPGVFQVIGFEAITIETAPDRILSGIVSAANISKGRSE